MKNKECYEYPEDNADPDSLAKRVKQHCGKGGGGRRRRRGRRGRRASAKERSRPCRKTKSIIKAFKEDMANLFILTTKVLPYDREKHNDSNFRRQPEMLSCPILTGCTGGRRVSWRTEGPSPSSPTRMRRKNTTGRRRSSLTMQPVTCSSAQWT